MSGRGQGAARTGAARVRAADRKTRVLDLRRTGMTIRAIADVEGISRTRAHELIVEALAALPVSRAEELRALELEKLDGHERALAAKCAKGDTRAVGASLRVAERRAKLLGLDMPTRHEVVAPAVVEGGEDLSLLSVTELSIARFIAATLANQRPSFDQVRPAITAWLAENTPQPIDAPIALLGPKPPVIDGDFDEDFEP